MRELVSERRLQSSEFESGKLLAAFIKGEVKQLPVTSKVAACRLGDGAYIVCPTGNSQNYIVFDLEEAPLFTKLDETGIILAFQKTLRFALKFWDNLKLSVNERIITGSTKAVVFPYPIGMQTELRVAIERSPDERRRARREPGSALLVYKFSDHEGGGANEDARLTNFRKAGENRQQGFARVAEVLASTMNQGVAGGNKALSVTQLDADGVSRPVFNAGLEAWESILTDAQNSFVQRPLEIPHRIEGPAGTGKTLCLVLKCLRTLVDARAKDREHRALFIAHSEATKRSIEKLFLDNDEFDFFGSETPLENKVQSVKVTTLQSLCAHLLRREISESELVDRDAYESKMTQTLYALDAIDQVLKEDLDSHRPFLSTNFAKFIAETDRWIIADMLRHEISVQIKGRADEDLDKYKKLARLKIGLPLENEGDRIFTFLMYERYQYGLETAAQFDTDDVVLSAISSLSTPIWRRRRSREGYDSIFIDETHLFNLNELSVFHRLTKRDDQQPIAYSVDRSQALGDRGWTAEAFDLAFDPETKFQDKDGTEVRSIFRCSPDIVNLAFSVTSSGATLFTNFHDPLVSAISAFTVEEERKTARPRLVHYVSDDAMLAAAFVNADHMAKDMVVSKADIVMIAFGNDIFAELQLKAKTLNKPVEVVKSRGDVETVNRARLGGKFVLTAPEFVGGLEFAGAILVGVDGGRVPPRGGTAYEDSQNYLSYASHQRVYVALTRARFRVEILGIKPRGISPLLMSAISSGLLEVVDG